MNKYFQIFSNISHYYYAFNNKEFIPTPVQLIINNKKRCEMDLKKFSMATVGGFFAMFIPGGLWHMLIMKDFYDKYTGDSALAEPNILFIILGVLILAALMAYMYPQGYKGGSSIKEGLRFGAVIGLLWVLPLNVIMIASNL